MSIEGFVRAAGAAMGYARESFGSGGAVMVSPAAGVAGSPTVFGGGSGRAADGFAAESGVVRGHIVALGEHDEAGEQQLRDALAAAGVGRDRMDSVIAAAEADVAAMGASTDTPAGRCALVAAIKRHLHDTQGMLDHAGADAQTRAAAANVTAAGYDGIGQQPPGGAAAAPMAAMGSPMGAMSALSALPAMAAMPMSGVGLPMGGGGLPLAPLAGLAGLFTQSHQTPTPGGLFVGSPGFSSGDGSVGDQVVKNALSQLGVRYSFGGGGKNGPGPGQDGVGLDCSGLVQYAFAKAGIDVPRTTYQLQHCGVAVPPGQARAGDILLCNYSGPGVPQHVQIVMSPSQTVEAPDRGLAVRIGHWPSGHFELRRLVNG
ncbi:C40 family peptidase [Mycobacterium riyadhense]|uniref:C40 family peptidase n=1 Tax=Mycobacterium riyadhense TaxID=486698 RepID=UPI00194E86B1|nr:C40 family peptidase [Mycobacterium riyadhense]